MSWDFINITYPKAAKPHRCAECQGEICVGERHSYTAGKVEGCFEDYRMCLVCSELAAAYCREFEPDEGFPLGSIRSALAEEGIMDIQKWLADSVKRLEDTNRQHRAWKGRVEALKETVICERCQATIATYAERCTAALDDPCPGFLKIEGLGGVA